MFILVEIGFVCSFDASYGDDVQYLRLVPTTRVLLQQPVELSTRWASLLVFSVRHFSYLFTCREVRNLLHYVHESDEEKRFLRIQSVVGSTGYARVLRKVTG